MLGAGSFLCWRTTAPPARESVEDAVLRLGAEFVEWQRVERERFPPKRLWEQ